MDNQQKTQLPQQTQDQSPQSPSSSLSQESSTPKMEKIKPLKIGQLISMDWKLGVTTKSNHCKNLNTPFVTISLRISDSDEKITTHSFELSIPEFINFAKQFEDMASLLESL